MGMEVPLVDSLERFGIAGLAIFTLAWISGAALWNAAFNSYERKFKDASLRHQLPRLAGLALLFLIALLVSYRVVSSKERQLARAAHLVEGKWNAGAGCGHPIELDLVENAGVLLFKTGDFTFSYKIDWVSQDAIQVHPPGAEEISILKRAGSTLFHKHLYGKPTETLTLC
jgi:hypothetical protein